MNNKYNNFNENQEVPQIIGFDQLTGQPIFNSGIGVREETNQPIQVEKKVMSKLKFIFHISLSFGLWGLVLYFILNLLVSGVNELVNNNIILYLIIFNILWISTSVLQIFLTYWFNKFNTTQEYQLRSVKNINLVLFLIGIFYSRSEALSRLFDINTTLSILMGIFLIIHMIAIWFVNEKLFDKWWGVDHF